MKGIYCLVIGLNKEQKIQIGKSGNVLFKAGNYVYTGSALSPGGLKARVGRHLRKDKKLRWHIDYLRQHARIVSVIASETNDKSFECKIAGSLCQRFEPIIGFGNSDCKNGCTGHLVFAGTVPSQGIKEAITEVFLNQKLAPVELKI